MKIAKKGVDNNFGYEVCWSFWVLTQMEVSVNEEIKGLSDLNDPMAVLSVLSAREKGFYQGALDLNYWQSMITNDGLYDSSWMLCYEAERRGWLRNLNGVDPIAEDQYFKKLRDKDVSFLNMDSIINPIDESDLFEETDFEHEIDMFELIYGA